MKIRHQKEVRAFPLIAAFSEEQLREGLVKLGLDPKTGRKEIMPIGAGCFIRKTDAGSYKEMAARHYHELNDAIAADLDGAGFIYDMFLSELINYEYSYTGDPTEALDALGITDEDLAKNDALQNGLKRACRACMDREE